MKWFFITMSIFFAFGTVGERDKDRISIYSVITVVSLILAYLTHYLE